MLANFSKGRALLLAAWFLIFCVRAHAQLAVPYQEVHTVADATHAVPVEHSFTIGTAGAYQVTLTDLGAALTPSAPLTGLKLAVTQGNSIVGTPLPTTAAAPQNAYTMQFNATANTTYVIHVIGTPGAAGSGPVDVQVTPVGSGGDAPRDFSDNLATATALPSDEATLDGTFTAGPTGSYTVTLADLQLPQALTTLTLLLTSNDGTLTVIPNTPLSAAGTATVTLQGGVSYRVFVVAQSEPTVDAGLFSVVIAPSGGAPVYSNVVPVGTVSQIQNVSLNAGTSYSLSLADLGFPNSLAGLRAVAALNGQVVAQLSAAGTSPAFTATTGPFQLFVLASTPNTGSYQLTVAPASGAPALSVARAVSASGSPVGYSYDTTVTSAGSYTLGLTDFAAPQALNSLQGAVVQAGQVVGAPLQAAGTQPVTMAAGPASLLVFSQGKAAGGVFDVNLTPSVGGAALFDATQGVGQPFVSRQLSITTAGSYAVNVADVGWPVPLTTFAVVATQGSNQLGLVYGAGAFSFTAATPGTYFINFIAQPGGGAGAGTYALNVAPGPVVSLDASTTTVSSGATITLTWSSTNTDSCSASGGWSGSQPTTGSATSAAITANTTFTLTCTGHGVNAAKSVAVTVNPPGKSGGGGAFDVRALLALAGALAAKLWLRKGGLLAAMLSLRRVFIAVAIAACGVALVGCGGAQSRLANHMERGQRYFSQGDFTKASIEFRNALQIAPKDPKALVMAGRTAEQLGHPRDAVGLYQAVVDSQPDNVEAREYLGRLMALHGQPDRALTVIEPALAKHPDDAALLMTRAAARMALKNRDGALADVERALQLAPANEDAIVFRAGLYRSDGDLNSAIALVAGGLAKSPASTALKEVLVNLYETAHKPDKAENVLRGLVTQKPQEPQFRYQLAAFYTQESKLDDAEHVLRDAAKAFHNDDSRLRLVGFLAARRDPATGERALREFIAANPGDYDLRLALGTLLQAAGKIDDSERAYNEIIEADGTGPSGLIARDRVAALQMGRGQYADARKLVNEVLQKSPRDSVGLGLLGDIELASHNPSGAIADLRAALRDQPHAVAIHRSLAKAYIASGEPALAEESLRAAVEQIPANVPLRLDLAALLIQRQHVDQALTLLEQSAQAAPQDPYLREALIRAYLAKRDFASARSTAETLKTLRPDSPAGSYLAGLAARGQNQLDDAQKEFTHALAVQPQTSDALAALAQLEVARGHGDQAVALVQDAAEHPRPNAFAYNLLGEIYLSLRKPDLAKAPVNRALELAPKWWVPYRNLAIAKYASGDTPGAIATYLAGVKAAPNEPALVVELAQLYQQQGNIDDAIASYEAWSRQNPRVAVVSNNLAMLLVTYKQDRASLDQARDLTSAFETSTDSSLLDTNGWVHLKRSEFSQALAVLQRALALAPDSKEIHYHLGMVELRLGQTDRARTDLETAVSGSPKFSGADDARTVLASLKGSAS